MSGRGSFVRMRNGIGTEVGCRVGGEGRVRMRKGKKIREETGVGG